MFDPLPPETIALNVLLADLHDELEGRVERLRLLLAIESDFGGGRGLLLPGGMPAQFAYLETRQAFVAGNFLSVILLSQCVLENVLAAQIGMESLSREIKGEDPIQHKARPTFRETIAACRRSLAAVLASPLGRPRLETQFAAYMSRLGASNSALLQQLPKFAGEEEPNDADKIRLLTYVLGHVLCNAILKYPGPTGD